jgi:hypothetical protein
MKPIGKYVLLLSLFVIPLLSHAQRGRGNFRLGFTASPTLGWMQFEDENSGYKADGSRIGYSYGIMGDFGFSDNYFFGSGFTLTTMSAYVNRSVTFPQGGTTEERIGYRIQYIEVPLTLKLKTGDESATRFYGQFGPDLGVKVSNKHDFTQLDVKEKANIIRLGLLIGAGAEWKLNRSDILTGVSFNNPFTKVFSNPDAKNYIVTLNFGVFF